MLNLQEYNKNKIFFGQKAVWEVTTVQFKGFSFNRFSMECLHEWFCSMKNLCAMKRFSFQLRHIEKCHSHSPSPLNSHPSGFQQLPTKLLCGVVEGELLTAQVIDRRVALQVEEQVVIKANFLGFFLMRKWRCARRGRGEQSVCYDNAGLSLPLSECV